MKFLFCLEMRNRLLEQFFLTRCDATGTVAQIVESNSITSWHLKAKAQKSFGEGLPRHTRTTTCQIHFLLAENMN